MNSRIRKAIFLATQDLKDVVRQSSRHSIPTDFQERHAEHLIAAGFGFPDFHSYLAALKANSERCAGYYIPDSARIRSRMTDLGYPPEVVRQCTQIFSRAVSEDGSARADLIDDLHGERQYIHGSKELANQGLLRQHLEWDILREESRLWSVLAKYGLIHDRETEDNLTCWIEFQHDFPSFRDLEQAIDTPFVVSYDLERGEDQEALFYKTNRRLELRGNLRLNPSGKRGWAYPTIRLEDTPSIDQRTPEEKLGEYFSYDVPDIDDLDFNSGINVGRRNTTPPSHASFSFLAGWTMTANEVNSTGHMSTGLVDRAFYGALDNAREVTGDQQAIHLAAQACRYLASSRTRRALEAVIEEATAHEGYE
ncbi:hypothetical protein ACWGPO_16085 [Achromobacter animicus]